MPRRTHPRPRVKHDRGHLREQRDRKLQGRYRKMRDHYWSWPSLHPEEVMAGALENPWEGWPFGLPSGRILRNEHIGRACRCSWCCRESVPGVRTRDREAWQEVERRAW